MSPNTVISHFGTQQAAADAIGVTQGAVSQWVTAGKIPTLSQLKYQTATGGVLVADETAQTLYRAIRKPRRLVAEAAK